MHFYLIILILSHDVACVQYTITITNFYVLHTCIIYNMMLHVCYEHKNVELESWFHSYTEFQVVIGHFLMAVLVI